MSEGNGHAAVDVVFEDEPAPESEDFLRAQLDAAHRRIAELEETVARRKLDTLTGLAPRSELSEFVRLHQSYPRPAHFAYVLLDLDRMKRINDTHGHLAGDAALVAASDAITANIRYIDGDIAVRRGGDEFSVCLSRPQDPVGAAIRIRNAVAAAVEAFGGGCSVGMAIFPDDGQSLLELEAVADDRLYQDKRRSTR